MVRILAFWDLLPRILKIIHQTTSNRHALGASPDNLLPSVVIRRPLDLFQTLFTPPSTPVSLSRRPSERPDPVLEAIKFFSVQEGHFSRDWEEPDLFELLPRIIEELFCAVVSVACALHDVPGGHFAAECVEEDVAAPV